MRRSRGVRRRRTIRIFTRSVSVCGLRCQAVWHSCCAASENCGRNRVLSNKMLQLAVGTVDLGASKVLSGYELTGSLDIVDRD